MIQQIAATICSLLNAVAATIAFLLTLVVALVFMAFALLCEATDNVIEFCIDLVKKDETRGH